MRNFSIPLIARYIDLSMYLDLKGNLTCIKLALYGCDAKLYAGMSKVDFLHKFANEMFSLRGYPDLT